MGGGANFFWPPILNGSVVGLVGKALAARSADEPPKLRLALAFPAGGCGRGIAEPAAFAFGLAIVLLLGGAIPDPLAERGGGESPKLRRGCE